MYQIKVSVPGEANAKDRNTKKEMRLFLPWATLVAATCPDGGAGGTGCPEGWTEGQEKGQLFDHKFWSVTLSASLFSEIKAHLTNS